MSSLLGKNGVALKPPMIRVVRVGEEVILALMEAGILYADDGGLHVASPERRNDGSMQRVRG